jgi:hypothetical protein
VRVWLLTLEPMRVFFVVLPIAAVLTLLTHAVAKHR